MFKPWVRRGQIFCVSRKDQELSGEAVVMPDERVAVKPGEMVAVEPDERVVGDHVTENAGSPEAP